MVSGTGRRQKSGGAGGRICEFMSMKQPTRYLDMALTDCRCGVEYKPLERERPA